jgi:hypothetical protein
LQAFSARDRDGTGYVTVDDAVAVLRSQGATLTSRDLRTALADLRVLVDDAGKLDYRKFVEAARGKGGPGGLLARRSPQCVCVPARACVLVCVNFRS